ncbi:Oidioi.mRNA.OKI2018_I69.chr1.g222.t1.cds [Oikopleura dioica]|uniref:Oidioi.mRNA.OKI2018_I69.chr1.g222.t1.cds n=1 Tax=Oikopleura dioica TaxID=34765 RepID=A0ABN7SPD4_OIKDI|nr:Oidioi.mRNA.OKI2018_I69.chr1.g222.t1.cds [Oikopleura dioica]
MKIEEWKKKNNITNIPDDIIHYKDTTLSALKNVFYEESDEWNLLGSVPVFDNVRVAPRLLFLFIISVVGSVFAHITIAMTLWYYDGRHENMYNFSPRRSKFAYNLAKFFQVFKADKYNIPLLILLNVDPVKYSDMKSDLKKKDYQAAWQFYGKMISHFWGTILTLAITISTIAILIDIHVESNCAISALE